MTTPIFKSQLYPPPFTHGNYIIVGANTVAGASRYTLKFSLHFIYHINLPDLAWLTIYPIGHNPLRPPMPTKIPLEIHKFEGKGREDPQNHIMSFHLWCSSKNIVDDSI